MFAYTSLLGKKANRDHGETENLRKKKEGRYGNEPQGGKMDTDVCRRVGVFAGGL
jgi:hypothetical protein